MVPVARNVWQNVDGGSPATAARRLIIASTSRRSIARAVSRRPAGLLEPGRLDVDVEGRSGLNQPRLPCPK